MSLPLQIATQMYLVGSLRQAPEHAAELAEIVTTWSDVEHDLVVAFSVIMQIPYAAAEKALHQLANAHARIKALRATNKDFAPSAEFHTAFGALLTKAESLALRRGKYVHGQWAVRGDGRVFLIDYTAPHESQGRMRPVPLADLKSLAGEITGMHSGLRDLINPLLPPPALPDSIAQRPQSLRSTTRKSPSKPKPRQ